MSKTKIVLAAAALAALTTAQVRADSQEQKDAKLCQDLTGVNTALGNLENLTKNSTVAETKAAAQRLSDAADKLSKSAKDARPQEGKAFDQARKDFKNSVNNVPKDATVGEVQANIAANRDRLKAAYRNLESSVTCPEPGTAPMQQNSP